MTIKYLRLPRARRRSLTGRQQTETSSPSRLIIDAPSILIPGASNVDIVNSGAILAPLVNFAALRSIRNKAIMRRREIAIVLDICGVVLALFVSDQLGLFFV